MDKYQNCYHSQEFKKLAGNNKITAQKWHGNTNKLSHSVEHITRITQECQKQKRSQKEICIHAIFSQCYHYTHTGENRNWTQPKCVIIWDKTLKENVVCIKENSLALGRPWIPIQFWKLFRKVCWIVIKSCNICGCIGNIVPHWCPKYEITEN